MRPSCPPPDADKPLFSVAAWFLYSLLVGCPPVDAVAADATAGVQPLLVVDRADIRQAIPAGSHALISAEAMEAFLVALDHTVPDWSFLYGVGHHDPNLDERLFQLNRARDERRRGNEALSRRISFCWSGTLSPYDSARGGFPVAVGPDFTKTAWGVVRFKPEELPANLTATAAADVRERLTDRITKGRSIDIKVVMTGRLIPEESLVYDFSHEEEGQGLIMPVVQVDQLTYILVASDSQVPGKETY